MKSLSKGLAIVALALSLRMAVVLLGTTNRDIDGQQLLANLVRTKINVYAATDEFPYAPVSLWVPSQAAQAARLLNLPFPVADKIPVALADALIAGTIYTTLARTRPHSAFAWAAMYAVNPIALLLVSHGNLIVMPTLFMLLAYTVLFNGVKENFRLSALLLGLAIGFRTFPILLLLPFLIKLPLSREQKVAYLLYATVPTALSTIPFLITDYHTILQDILRYSGHNDFGPTAIVRAIQSIKAQRPLFTPINPELASFAKGFFLASQVLLTILLRKHRLIDLVMLTWLLFYALYVGVSAQYFIWILPFAFIAKDRLLPLFTATGTAALASFYAIYHPNILFGRFTPPPFPIDALLYSEGIWLTALWLTCAAWALRLITQQPKRHEALI